VCGNGAPRMRTDPARVVADMYTEHHPWILGWLTRKTQDPAFAEDLTAATFERALRYADRFDGRNPGGWLRVMARNVLYDHHKAAVARRETPVAEITDTADDEPDLDSIVVDRILANLAAGEISRRITRLATPRQAEVLRLRLIHGLSIPQTAKILGISEGAVKTAQHHGVACLRESVTTQPIEYLTQGGTISELATAIRALNTQAAA